MTEDERFDLIRLWLIRCALLGIPCALSYFFEVAAIMFSFFGFLIFAGYADLFIHRVSPDDWGTEHGGGTGMAAPAAVMFHNAWQGRSPLGDD